jgi:4-amino-4-deoxy-L-arabinose transferase-like glycosyltransferase
MSQRLAPLLLLLLAAFLRLTQLASIPFGWHPDEATKALLARDVLAGEGFPLYFSAFTGREALYVYLEAAFISLVGEGVFTGRLLSAMLGILTVALTYALGRQLFNRRTALLAAALLSVSLWYLIASRNGYRAIIQPAVQLLALSTLLVGLRKGDWRQFALSGFFIGLSQYTYTAARFFPILMAAIVIAWLLCHKSEVRSKAPRLALAASVTFLVFLPLGIHFLRNPVDFYGRAAQISIFATEFSGGDAAGRLWQSVKETVRMWSVWGDINYRFNIPGKPVFGYIDGLLFYAGIVVSAVMFQVSKGGRRFKYTLLFLWVAIMLLPMVLSAESLPYYQRAIGVLPAIFFFPALAFDSGISQLEKRWHDWGKHGGRALALLLIGTLAGQTYHDYFQKWHLAESNDDHRRVAMVYVADYLQAMEVPETVYLSSQYLQHPTLAMLAPAIYDRIQWFDAQQSLPLPPPGAEATYVMLLENPPQPKLLETSGLTLIDEGRDRFARPVFHVFSSEGGALPIPTIDGPAIWSWETQFEAGDPQGLRHPIEMPVRFGEVLDLTGRDISNRQPAPGETVELILHWRILGRPERNYTFFAHVLSADGQVVTGFDANTYPSTFWQDGGGEYLLSYFPLALPPDLAEGIFQLEVGAYHQPSGERLPIMEAGEVVADRLLFDPIEVRR